MSSGFSKLVVTCALTGSIHIPSQSPYLPITPDQIASEAYKAYKAGAAIVHVHARDPETGQPSPDLNLFREILTLIREKCDVIVNTTTGGGHGFTREQRISVVPTFQAEIASLNAGSMNFCLSPIMDRIKTFKHEWEPEYLESSKDYVFRNTFADLEYYLEVMQRHETKPELEIYDAGQCYNVAYLVSQGILEPPVWMQFVMGILGGIGASVENLLFLKNTVDRLFSTNYMWSVCAAGRHEIPLTTLAIILGGHVRVGLEDALYLERGVLAKSNEEFVAKIVRIAKELGREIATPDDARSMLGLKGSSNANF